MGPECEVVWNRRGVSQNGCNVIGKESQKLLSTKIVNWNTTTSIEKGHDVTLEPVTQRCVLSEWKLVCISINREVMDRPRIQFIWCKMVVKMVVCEVVCAMFVWFPVVDSFIMVRFSFLCQDLVVGFLGGWRYVHNTHTVYNEIQRHN